MTSIAPGNSNFGKVVLAQKELEQIAEAAELIEIKRGGVVYASVDAARDVFGEAQDPPVGDVGLEAKAVGDRRGDEDRDWRGECKRSRFKCHRAAAALDQQDLKEVAMPVSANGPLVDRRARGDGFDVNEIERLIVRRIAVEVEEGQRSGHGLRISQPAAGVPIGEPGQTSVHNQEAGHTGLYRRS